MESLEPRSPFAQPVDAVEPARVPRRFGVGTLLLFATMYALLFALMQTLGAAPALSVSLAGLFTAVGLGQMLLFGGKRPRFASFLAGGSAFCALFVGGLIVSGDAAARWIIPAAPFYFLFGGGLGYLAGCLLAGVFLLLKPFERPEEQGDAAEPFASEHGGGSERSASP